MRFQSWRTHTKRAQRYDPDLSDCWRPRISEILAIRPHVPLLLHEGCTPEQWLREPHTEMNEPQLDHRPCSMSKASLFNVIWGIQGLLSNWFSFQRRKWYCLRWTNSGCAMTAEVLWTGFKDLLGWNLWHIVTLAKVSVTFKHRKQYLRVSQIKQAYWNDSARSLEKVLFDCVLATLNFKHIVRTLYALNVVSRVCSSISR